MKIIETKETGGEIQKHGGLFFGAFNIPEAGDTSRRVKETTYEGILQIPFRLEREEMLAPALDKNGKVKEGEENVKPRITGLWIELPFDLHDGTGVIKFHCYRYSDKELDENELGELIKLSLGNEIFSYKLPRKKDD